MFSYIKKYMLKRKLRQIKSKIDSYYRLSVEYQRNGKLREYAQTLEDVQALEDEYLKLSNSEE